MKQDTYVRMSDWVRRLRHGEKIVKIVNMLATEIVYIAFISLLIILLIQRDDRIVRVVLVTGISFVLVSIFRNIYNADRPYTLYNFEPIIKKEKRGESMPSRHVFSAFVIAMAFLYISPVLSIVIFCCGIIMAFGRVVAGVHFPKDVIVGVIFGIMSGVIGFYII